MSEDLIQTAVRARITPSREIDFISEGEHVSNRPGTQATLSELKIAYHALKAQLSIELHTGARALIQTLRVAEFESWRAMLRPIDPILKDI